VLAYVGCPGKEAITRLFMLNRMEGGEAKQWPGFTGKAYPEVFNTIPPQPQNLKPGQLSEEEVKKFFDEVSIEVSICKSALLVQHFSVLPRVFVFFDICNL